ncbi:hypothetical protein BH24ACT22_BH24ACT22_14490 [soil metagenome]
MRFRAILITSLFLVILMGTTRSGGVAEAQQASLEDEFARTAEEYEVPKGLLKAIGHVNTRWEMPPPGASDYESSGPREGEPEARGAYGIMQLVQNPSENTLGRAAELTGLSEEELKTERAANIRGGAAVLSAVQDVEEPANINDWYDAVAEYAGGTLYADQVYETLQSGASEELSSGEKMVLEAQPEAETKTTYSAQASADYGRATWYGAYSGNYWSANRPDYYTWEGKKYPAPINKIIIHVTQGSWAGAINWFKDSRAGTSAHYTVRSDDGKIGQSVREKNIAYHAGNWNYNVTSVGIEHEGYVSESKWFTDSMYRSSARLTAYLCKKYRIKISRNNIIGHNEVPGATHTDPGSNWNWTKYMRLVKGYAGSSTSKPAYQQVVDNTSSRFRASRAWNTNSWNSQKYGKNYRAVKPARKGTAKFKLKVPKKAGYVVSAWWPASSKYNNRTKFKIRTASGWKRRVVNQRTDGGKWVRLGKFTMKAGDRVHIKIPRRTKGSGYIIADAVKVVRP